MTWPQSGGYAYPSPYERDPRPQSAVLAPVRGLALAAVLGLSLWVVVQLGYVGVNAWRYTLLGRLEEGEAVDPDLLAASDLMYGVAAIMSYGAVVIAAVLFIVWLFRVRANAEKISDRAHRWGRPWLVLSWLIPFANLWWPKRLVDDIWLASDPRFVGAPDTKRSWLVRGWWTMWALFLILDYVAQIPGTSTQKVALREAAESAILVTPVGIVAAVLAVLVVVRLSAIQDVRARELAAMIG